MNCPICGKKNDEGVRYCISCGMEFVKPNKHLLKDLSKLLSNISLASIAQFAKKVVRKIKSLPKIVTTISIIVSVVLLVLIVMALIGSRLTNPKRMAKAYFVAQINKEWGEMYKYISTEDSDFTDKKAFEALMERKHERTSDVVNYSIKESTSKDKKGFIRTYTVTYISKGSSTQQTEVITLIKNNKKRLLFFDDYYVSIADTIASNYQVSVPINSKVFIDGIEITNRIEANENYSEYNTFLVPPIFIGDHTISIESELFETVNDSIYVDENEHYYLDNVVAINYLVSVPKNSKVFIDGVQLSSPIDPSDRMYEDYGSEEKDIYLVPPIAIGTHELEVSQDICESFNEDIFIESDGFYNVSEMVLKEEEINRLSIITQQNFVEICKNAISGNDYEELALACVQDKDLLKEIINKYNNFVARMKSEDGTGYKSITINKFSDISSQTILNDEKTYTCELQFEYDYVKITKDWWTNELTETPSEYSQTSTIQFIYQYNGEEWLIRNIYELGIY